MRGVATLIVLAAATPTMAACGGSKGSDASGGTSTTTAAPAATTTTKSTGGGRKGVPGCRTVAAPSPRAHPSAPRSRRRLPRSPAYDAVVRTSCGTIVIRLAARSSPRTVASFAGLVRRRYFDRLTFHRVARPGGNDFVIQGGDPLLNGSGGPGYTVVEAPSRRTRYRRYVVAMAKTETQPRGASGSQFFIVTAADAMLPPDYAVLGLVTGGRKVVLRIAHVPTDATSEEPLQPVVIDSVRLRRER